MKKIILFILLGFLVANAQPGQSRYQGRTGYQQSIIWNDLHKSQTPISSIFSKILSPPPTALSIPGGILGRKL